jgi:hypothetical protein
METLAGQKEKRLCGFDRSYADSSGKLILDNSTGALFFLLKNTKIRTKNPYVS